MSRPAVSLLLALLAFAGWTGTTEGIRCFQCNSMMEPECSTLKVNDTRSPFYRDCPVTAENKGKPLFCRKTEQIIYDTDVVHTRIIRGCGWVRFHKADCYYFKNKGHEDTSCQCFSDGCNGGERPLAALGLMGLASVFLLFRASLC